MKEDPGVFSGFLFSCYRRMDLNFHCISNLKEYINVNFVSLILFFFFCQQIFRVVHYKTETSLG